VVARGCAGRLVAVVECSVLVWSDAQPGKPAIAENSNANAIEVPAFVMAFNPPKPPLAPTSLPMSQSICLGQGVASECPAVTFAVNVWSN
jgi:hypothetical protein